MKINEHYDWSSHLPLIKAVLSVFKPEMVMELGTGLHSTKAFAECPDIKKLICVEQDKEWLDEVQGKINNLDIQFIFDDMTDYAVVFQQFLKDLNIEQRNAISQHYLEFAMGKTDEYRELVPKLLFVDNFTSCRALAIDVMYNFFDIFIYHDCEPNGILWYEYYFNKDIQRLYVHYVLKTPTAWTGCFIRRSLHDYTTEEKLRLAVQPYCDEFSSAHGLNPVSVCLERHA